MGVTVLALAVASACGDDGAPDRDLPEARLVQRLEAGEIDRRFPDRTDGNQLLRVRCPKGRIDELLAEMDRLYARSGRWGTTISSRWSGTPSTCSTSLSATCRRRGDVRDGVPFGQPCKSHTTPSGPAFTTMVFPIFSRPPQLA